eukprot:g16082.t1
MAASSRSLHRLLDNLGWECERITGSHHIFTKPGYGCIPVSIHSKNSISRAAFLGTLKRLRTATEERDKTFLERKNTHAKAKEGVGQAKKTSTSPAGESTAQPKNESVVGASAPCISGQKIQQKTDGWRLPNVLVEELAHEPALVEELEEELRRLRAELRDKAHALVDELLEEVFDLLGIDAFEQAERKLKIFFYEHKLFSAGKVLKEMRSREAPGLMPEEVFVVEKESAGEQKRLSIKALLSPETLEELDFILLSTIRARVFRVIDTGFFVSAVETAGLWQILALVDDMNAKFWRHSEVVSDKREDMLKNLATRFNARLTTEMETTWNRMNEIETNANRNDLVRRGSLRDRLWKDLGECSIFLASVTDAFNFVAETVEKGYLKKHYVVENFGHAFALSVNCLLEDVRTRFFEFREFEKTAGILDRLLKVFGVPICEGGGGTGAGGAGFSGEISSASWYVLMKPSPEDLSRADNELRLAPGALTVKENASAMRKLFLQGLDEGVGGANTKSKTNASSSSSTLASVQAKLILSKQHREEQFADQKQKHLDYVLYTPDHAQEDLAVLIEDGPSMGGRNMGKKKMVFGLMFQGLKDCDRKLESAGGGAFDDARAQAVELEKMKITLGQRKKFLCGLYNCLRDVAERTSRRFSREFLEAKWGGWYSEAQVREQLQKEWGMDPLEGAPKKEDEDDGGEKKNGGRGGKHEHSLSTPEDMMRFIAETITPEDIERLIADMSKEEDEKHKIAAAKDSGKKVEVEMKNVDGYVKHREAAELAGGGGGTGDSTSSSSAPTIIIRATNATTAVAMLQQVELFTACAWYLMELVPIYLQLEAYGVVPSCSGLHAFFPKKGLLQGGQMKEKQNMTQKTAMKKQVVRGVETDPTRFVTEEDDCRDEGGPSEEGRTRAGKPYIFCVGDRVNVKELKSKAELNGQRAEVVGCVKKSDAETRYAVKLLHVHTGGASTSSKALSVKPENLSLIRTQKASLLQNREAAEQVGYLHPSPNPKTGEFDLKLALQCVRAVPDVEVEIAPEVKHDENLKKLIEDFFAKTEGFARLIFGGDGRSTSTIPPTSTSGATNNSTTVPATPTTASADADVLFVPTAPMDVVKLDAVAAVVLEELASDVLQATSDVLILLHHNWSSDICTREIPQRVFQLFELHGNKPRHEVFSKYWNKWAPFHNSVMTDLQAWTSSFVTLLLRFRLSFEVQVGNARRTCMFHGSAKSSSKTCCGNNSKSSSHLESLVTINYKLERENAQKRMGIAHDVCKFAKSYRLIRWVYLPSLMERIGFLRDKTGPREMPNKIDFLTALCNEWFEKAVLHRELAAGAQISGRLPRDVAAVVERDPKLPMCCWLEHECGLPGIFGDEDMILRIKAATIEKIGTNTIVWAYNNAPGPADAAAGGAFPPGGGSSGAARQTHVGAGPSMRFYHQGIMKKAKDMQTRDGERLSLRDMEGMERWLASVYTVRCTFEVQFFACIQLEDLILQETRSEALAVLPPSKQPKTNIPTPVLSIASCIPSHCAHLKGYNDAALFDSIKFGRKTKSLDLLAVEALTWKLLRLVLVGGGSPGSICSVSPKAKTFEKFVAPLQFRAQTLLPLLKRRDRTLQRLKFFRANCLLGFRQIAKTSRFWDFEPVTITNCFSGGARQMDFDAIDRDFMAQHRKAMPECREQEVFDLLSDLKYLAQCSERLKVELQPVFGGDFRARLKTVELKAAIAEIGKAIGCEVGEVDDGVAAFGGESDMKAAGGGCKANGSSFAPPPRMNADGMNEERDPLVQKYFELKSENSEWTNKQLAKEMGISTEKLKRIAREAKKHLNT